MTREAFINQVEDTQEALRRFLGVLCRGDAPRADDIAQEAYVKAYLASDTLGDESRFRPWLYRIAYNTFVSSARTERLTDDVDVAVALPSGQRADASFEYQELYVALERLSEKERTAILLYYMEGYQTDEIAVITGMSADAVRQQLSRGRAHLREILKR